MHIHEYQAKALLRTAGIPVPLGIIAHTSEEAREAAKILKAPWVLKAQIHAGGRGKAGGIKRVSSLHTIKAAASQLLRMTLGTSQTSTDGKLVRKIYIEEAISFSEEFYLSLLMDRSTSRLIFLASREGGMEIEELAHTAPHKIIHAILDPAIGFSPFQGRKLAYALGLKAPQIGKLTHLLQKIYDMFIGLDASLIEINPLVLTKDGEFMALDAKMSFDDNALYRHPEIAALRDPHEEDPREYQASQHEMSYVKLQGNIGCLVNGAGLAMATLDLLTLYGGSPANFLDVGGGATQARVKDAFKVILADPQVEGIFINIFGGIVRCDVIAEGIVASIKDLSPSLPLVVRLEGNHSTEGKKVFEKEKLPVIWEDNFSKAAERIVKEVR